MNIFYTGIGSRETPKDIMRLMHDIAAKLASQGLTLRSGGADGADDAFECGCASCNGAMEIYVPWPGFNGRLNGIHKIPLQAGKIAEQFHPAWHKLNQGAQKLMTRNVCQVLGANLQTPSRFVICWTKDGKASGGTGQAMRIAMHHQIPIINLQTKTGTEQAYEFLQN